MYFPVSSIAVTELIFSVPNVSTFEVLWNLKYKKWTAFSLLRLKSVQQLSKANDSQWLYQMKYDTTLFNSINIYQEKLMQKLALPAGKAKWVLILPNGLSTLTSFANR